MRVYLIYAFCLFLAVYSWKDWFKALCGLILVTAVMGYSDFPERFGGIQGLNLWNIIFANASLSWLISRRKQGLIWDMPKPVNFLLVLWLVIILVGWVWMVVDRTHLEGLTLIHSISEQLINTIKFPLVALILFDGCRTRKDVKVVLASIFLFYLLVAVQIARFVPPSTAFESLNLRAQRLLKKDIGMSPNTSAKVMAGAPWVMLAMTPLLKKKRYKLFMFGACVLSLYALALTQGRAGYVACGASLVFLGLVRWRWKLLLLPLLIMILPIVLPGAADRMMMGFGQGEENTNLDVVTAGRNDIWNVVIPKIKESPLFGYGREAMRRTGLQHILWQIFGKGYNVSHPHNAYFEVLLDSGLIGLAIIGALHFLFMIYSIRLFADRKNALYTTVGGVVLAILVAHLVDHLGGQHFYPGRLDLGFWCAIGIMMRVHVEQTRYRANTREALAGHVYAHNEPSLAKTSFEREWVTS